MTCRTPVMLLSACLLLPGSSFIAGAAGVSVEPEALTHYSYCVNEAKDHDGVFVFARRILYRCHGDVAVSYFNFLSRRRDPPRRVEDETGVYLYRAIDGVGRCWNKILDEARVPVSAFGCDIYVDI